MKTRFFQNIKHPIIFKYRIVKDSQHALIKKQPFANVKQYPTFVSCAVHTQLFNSKNCINFFVMKRELEKISFPRNNENINISSTQLFSSKDFFKILYTPLLKNNLLPMSNNLPFLCPAHPIVTFQKLYKISCNEMKIQAFS